MADSSSQWLREARQSVGDVLDEVGRLDADEASARWAEAARRRCGLSPAAVVDLTPEHIRPTLSDEGGLARGRTVELALILAQCGVPGSAKAAASLVAIAAERASFAEQELAVLLLDAVRAALWDAASPEELALWARALRSMGCHGALIDLLEAWLRRDPTAALDPALSALTWLGGLPDSALSAGGCGRERIERALAAVHDALHGEGSTAGR